MPVCSWATSPLMSKNFYLVAQIQSVNSLFVLYEDTEKRGLRDYFQPTVQPTVYDVLCDFRVLWQSPRSCKLL